LAAARTKLAAIEGSDDRLQEVAQIAVAGGGGQRPEHSWPADAGARDPDLGAVGRFEADFVTTRQVAKRVDVDPKGAHAAGRVSRGFGGGFGVAFAEIFGVMSSTARLRLTTFSTCPLPWPRRCCDDTASASTI
jgi:hypothetical protein